MKNLGKFKSVLIYGIIILLCVAAFTGYLITNHSGEKSDAPRKATAGKAADSQKEATATASTATAEKAMEHNARIIPVGEDITGKSEEEKEKHVKEVMKKSLLPLDPNPVIGVGRGEDYAKVTVDAVENAGGLKDIVKKGDVVLIKPNICMNYFSAGTAQITDYRTVQAVADMVLQLGASKVVVAEGSISGNAFENDKNGYVSLKGVELFNFNDCEKKDCYELKPEKSVVGKALFIPKIYMDADVVITVAKLKTHSITWSSLSLKNAIGVPSEKIYGQAGNKSGLHSLDINSVIVDLNRIRRPDFSIIEGIVGGDGDGPLGNIPIKSNVIFAGKNMVALDTVAENFMTGMPQMVSYLELAEKNGLGTSDMSKIKLVGADLNAIKMNFQH